MRHAGLLLMLGSGTSLTVRFGRRLLWGRPVLYRWVGIIRGRGDCLQNGFDVWIGGYPRSANSFATAAFKLGNPEVRVATHMHIPAFVINALDQGKPGILLVRKPTDAVLSWTAFWEGQMKINESVDYYIDFHRSLLPYRQELFVASFEEAVSNFQLVIGRFNEKFGTAYHGLASDEALFTRCVSYVEDWFRDPDGAVNELKVPRPSKFRAELKTQLMSELQGSPTLMKKMTSAVSLYETFSGEQNRHYARPSKTATALGFSES